MSEISWFSALCDDDYEQLGVPQLDLRSSWEHCSDIVHAAQDGGFDNVLLPSGYDLGIDTLAFASAIAPTITSMKLLAAILNGRLSINIISSEMPGEALDGPSRYARTLETMTALRTLLSGKRLDIDGEHLQLHVDAPRICRDSPSTPQFYFGGLSDEARDVAAAGADVYLMWPDTEDVIAETIADLQQRASTYGRTLKFGYRVHVVVRETEDEARSAAAHLISAVDAATGDAIRSRSLDSTSVGVRRQAELRESAGNDGFVEPHLWTGIGKARSGCGAAIVGTPQQVIDKIHRYEAMGVEAFIFSGYPHKDEAERFADLVLPHLNHGPL